MTSSKVPLSALTVKEYFNMLETHQFVRKEFHVDGVQITDKNMQDVCDWVNGAIETNDNGKQYIKVDVQNPLNPKQTQGYVGDWILAAKNGFKVYTNRAFRSSFEQVSVETRLQDTTRKPVEPEPVIFVPPAPPVISAPLNDTHQ